MRIPVHLRQQFHGRPPSTAEIALTDGFVQDRRWTFVDVRGALLPGLFTSAAVREQRDSGAASRSHRVGSEWWTTRRVGSRGKASTGQAHGARDRAW
jgi:hypothetical protein